LKKKEKLDTKKKVSIQKGDHSNLIKRGASKGKAKKVWPFSGTKWEPGPVQGDPIFEPRPGGGDQKRSLQPLEEQIFWGNTPRESI